ncbi:class I SAM-dependent methyltransferase [bacterium]|nr:class I SAM-dependent methyltransferase [bacterium]
MRYNFDSIIKDTYSSFARDKSEIPFNAIPRIDPRISLYLNERLSQRPVKDQVDILREYENDKWGGLLSKLVAAQDFSHKSCMIQFYGHQTIPMFFLDHVFEVRVLDYQTLATALMSDFIKELAGERPVDLLELGCGFGGTLMGVARRLSLRSRLCSVTGLDISESGLQILTKMAEVEGMAITTGIHDFAADIPVPKMEGGGESVRFAFTNFSLAALTNYPGNPISNILKTSGANYLIVFEPMGLEKDNLTFASFFTDIHIKYNSYNSDIREFIKLSVNDGLCKVLYNCNDIIGASAASTISFYIIESNC